MPVVTNDTMPPTFGPNELTSNFKGHTPKVGKNMRNSMMVRDQDTDWQSSNLNDLN